MCIEENKNRDNINEDKVFDKLNLNFDINKIDYIHNFDNIKNKYDLILFINCSNIDNRIKNNTNKLDNILNNDGYIDNCGNIINHHIIYNMK